MSLARVHLVDSDVPLKEGMDTTAWCGVIVPRAAFVMFWDHAAIGGEVLYCGTNCKQCDARPVESKAKRYLYGIIPGEESLHNGDAA